VYVSAVSVWEIAIKLSIRRLELAREHASRLPALIVESQFLELPVTALHASGVRDLPFHHADPFDRLLLAQASAEGMTIVSADEAFELYGAPVLAADE
jgi:PIN domain nuclease of toxin-antitoxin system